MITFLDFIKRFSLATSLCFILKKAAAHIHAKLSHKLSQQLPHVVKEQLLDEFPFINPPQAMRCQQSAMLL